MDKKRKSDMSVFQKATELTHLKKNKKKKVSFFQKMKDEMNKVSWTTKEELWLCGKIVIGTIFTLGIGIYFFDLIIRQILNALENLVRLIGA